MLQMETPEEMAGPLHLVHLLRPVELLALEAQPHQDQEDLACFREMVVEGQARLELLAQAELQPLLQALPLLAAREAQQEEGF